MLSKLCLTNFMAHTKSEIALDPFTVFVGPNASGKSSALTAVQMLGRLLREYELPVWPPQAQRAGTTRSEVGVYFVEGGQESKLYARIDGAGQRLTWTSPRLDGLYDGMLAHEEILGKNAPTRLMEKPYGRAIRDAIHFELLPALIAAPSNMEEVVPNLLPNGSNTAAILAAIKLADVEAFRRVEQTLIRVVPAVKALHVVPTKVGHGIGFGIEFEFQGQEGKLAAECASSGTLVTLAIITALYSPARPRLLLLDEIDHSLHPRAQMELIRQLRAVQTIEPDLQILAATHSPYILDVVEASNVRVFALTKAGEVRVRSLAEHPNAARTQGALSAGELWSLDDEQTWVS